MKKFYIFFMFLTIQLTIFPTVIQAEGTKELKPTRDSKGSLLIWHTYSRFGQFGAPSSNQLKIRVADTTERIYYGMTNKNGGPGKYDNGPFVPNLPYRILSPSGKIVFSSLMPGPGQKGHTNTWDEAVAGPAQLGITGGYDALEVIPKETGDYVIEFNPLAMLSSSLNIANRLAIDNFDFTVATKDKKIVTGRLHSQGWQITCEKFEYPFIGKVYPYDGGNAVYEVDFNGMNPLVFIINFNSKGTLNSDDFIDSRKSRIGNYAFPQFEVFLNPPDEKLYPVEKRDISMSASVVKKDCYSSDYCLNYTTNAAGILDVFLDFNKNGKYEAAIGEVFFRKQIKNPGTECISWNGRDSRGRVMPGGDYNVISRFSYGPMNLPLYDAEHNKNGYKINIIRPAGSTQPDIFWDDSRIIEGTTLGDPLVNLDGCQPSVTGCHRWANRGSIFQNDTLGQSKQETINTWWFSSTLMDTLLFNMPYDHHVKLSFHPEFLIGGDTTVCKGDTLNFYIFDNKKPHFDLSRFTYEWAYNGAPENNNIQTLQKQINSKLLIKVKATEKTGLGCISYDSLLVKLVEPVKLKAEINSFNCTSSEAFIKVNIVSGPPNATFFWEKFPALRSGTVSGLASGDYLLTVKDTNYSDRCKADTSFTILKGTEVVVSTVDAKGTICYNADGIATVKMKNTDLDYDYSWDGGPFIKQNSRNDLGVGKHKVQVVDPATGCHDLEEFIVPTVKSKFDLKKQDVFCNLKTGFIDINIPFPDYKVYWNQVESTKDRRDSLGAGLYYLQVRSDKYKYCSFDTVVALNNKNYSIPANFEYEITAAGNAANEFTLAFKNLSTLAKVNKWDFGDGNTSEDTNPIHTYTELGEQFITLKVYDSLGCPGIVIKPLRLAKKDPCGIAFPNAFSPNDDYKHNDIGILGYAPKVELKIFNRWGEVIFRTFEISKRWDGYYRNEPCPVGVYPFILDWECPAEDGTMRKFQKVGDVTLLR